MNPSTDTNLLAIKSWLGTGSINIFGLPYAGKDTHGKWLSDLFGATLLGGGDIMRNSIIPDHVKTIIDAGGLAPTDEYMRIVLPYLSNDVFRDKPMVLSSVGRWHGEEQGVLEATDQSGHPIKAVIYLHISMQTANSRFNRALETGDRGLRRDDDKEKLIVRFSEFAEKTLPVIEFYRNKGLLIEIDGNPPVEEVRGEIIRQLRTFAER